MPSVSQLTERRAGVILHPTSLPSRLGKGDLGPEAYRFVEFLAASGMRVWQVLPLSPTHPDGSPYHSPSINAGNPLLISLDLLVEQGWLSAQDRSALEKPVQDYGALRHTLLKHAYQGFLHKSSKPEHDALNNFVAQQSPWLEDYALYQALKQAHDEAGWVHWPTPLRDREPAALQQAALDLQEAIAQIRFEQFVFFQQWSGLKAYANNSGVQMFGDMPIFVAHDSADVWAHRYYFQLDAAGHPLTVAGVPPDYFSPQGQRWGHPHYHWERMQQDGFRYWMERVKNQLQIYDLLRIDHFRGFEAHWEIPAGDATAINGRWVKVPGDALFAALQQTFGPLPLVAEDLGVITTEVVALRKKYGLPGMKVLQFAFDGTPHNPYLPHQHEHSCVVYTGTHDNDTTLGWFNSLSHDAKNYVDDYLGSPGEPMPWPLIRAALESVANLAMLPMQDILSRGSEHRMNTPGTIANNWQWQFSWEHVTPDIPERLQHLTRLYGRS